MRRYFLILFTLFSFVLAAQTTVETGAKIEKKGRNWDTTKYQKFERVLIIGLFQQYRTFNNEFNLVPRDSVSQHVYSAESNLTGGFVFSFDKFQFSLATRNNPSSEGEGKGYTKMFNLGLNVGDNRWVSETYFRKFKGFYDKNVSAYDSVNKITKYYIQPNMVNRMLMQRFMYFTNYKKYSFKSGFGCNYRQLRSAATFILGGSFSIFDLQNDSAILPMKARAVYGDYGNMDGFTTVNLGVNGGFAATIVLWRAIFISAHFTLGPESQWRNYYLGDINRKLTYISFSGTGRGSLGINLKKFYMLFSVTNDYNLYNQRKARTFSSNSLTNNVTLGWRFHCRTPKFYQSFMKTKLYNLF
jgi:hypothetical protein